MEQAARDWRGTDGAALLARARAGVRAEVEALFDALTPEAHAAARDRLTENMWRRLALLWRYSFNNQYLITAQRPNATEVHGRSQWARAGFHVREGEVPIFIYRPMSHRGWPWTIAEIFDITQVEGRRGPPRQVVDAERWLPRIEAAAELLDIRIEILADPVALVAHEVLEGTTRRFVPKGRGASLSSVTLGAAGADGRGHRVEIHPGLAAHERALVLLHEYAHILLHARWRRPLRLTRDQRRALREALEDEARQAAEAGAPPLGTRERRAAFRRKVRWTERALHEIEADAVAAVVARALDLPSASGTGDPLERLLLLSHEVGRQSLERHLRRVAKAARAILTAIDGKRPAPHLLRFPRPHRVRRAV